MNSASLLLVDDDAAIRASLRFALEVEGYQVEAYASAEALAAQHDFPAADCLVLDYRLPGMDGLTLLALLRGRGIAIPAVLITSDPRASLQRRAAEAGVAIVEKPLLGNALADSIRQALGEAEQGDDRTGMKP